MNQSIKSVKQQIEEIGGYKSSEILSRIFEELNQEIGREFNVEDFFEKLLERYSLTNETYLSRDVYRSTIWNGNGTNNGFNVIPSNNPNGICSSFCLTIAKEGFKFGLIHPKRIKHQKINFLKAMLLLTEYWFACMNINDETLILTPDWNQDDFEMIYQGIIDNYSIFHKKKVFIVEISKVGPILRYPY
jgi:hypothetical protein